MRDKRLPLREAVGLIEPGGQIGLTSPSLDNAPMAVIREIIRQRLTDLHLVTLTGGSLNADLLIGSGLLAEYETCSCTFGPLGKAPNFDRAVKSDLLHRKDNN